MLDWWRGFALDSIKTSDGPPGPPSAVGTGAYDKGVDLDDDNIFETCIKLRKFAISGLSRRDELLPEVATAASYLLEYVFRGVSSV